MGQYFDNDNTTSKPKIIKIAVLNHELDFVTDVGIFSKDEIDSGTKFLIETISKQNSLSGKALDLGCGNGIVGIFLTKIFPKLQFTFSDVNERAIKLTAENCKKHGVTSEVLISDCFDKLKDRKFFLIVSNPPLGQAILFYLRCLKIVFHV